MGKHKPNINLKEKIYYNDRVENFKRINVNNKIEHTGHEKNT